MASFLQAGILAPGDHDQESQHAFAQAAHRPAGSEALVGCCAHSHGVSSLDDQGPEHALPRALVAPQVPPFWYACCDVQRKKQEQKERKKGKSVGEPDVGESRAVPIPEPSPPEEGAEAAAAACVVAEAAAAAAAAAAAEASEAAAHNSPAATEAAPEVPAVSAPTANQEVKKQGKAKKKVEEGAKHDIAGAGIVVAPANASAAEAAAVPAQVSTGAVSAGEVKVCMRT